MVFNTFLNFFKNLAIQNKAIGHVVGNSKSSFHWILVSNDPFQGYYIDHLLDAQRNSLPVDKPFMVVENYVAEPDVKNDGDFKTDHTAAFIILQNAKQGDLVSEEEVLTNTEIVARQIIARMKRDMSNVCNVELLNQFKYEHIGPALGGKYFGTKVHFEFNDLTSGQFAVVDNEWFDLD